MNKVLLGAVMAALGLAACGGGSSNGITPQPVATATPTVSPTQTASARVEYSWQGALAPNGGTTIQSLRRTLSTSSTPIPVQASLCDPRTNDCRPPGQQTRFSTDTNPYINLTDSASPAPSAAPTVSPPPGQAVALEKSNAPIFTYQVQTPSKAGCGDMGVTFPNATGTVRLCTYPVFTIGCIASLSTTPGGGYSTAVQGGYSFDTQSYTTDVVSSDVYVTGENCPGAFSEQETAAKVYVVHFPYGATALPGGQYSLATIDPTLWANTFTTLALNQDDRNNATCGGNLACIILVKTKAGNIVEFQATELNAAYDGIPADANNDPNYEGNWFTAAYSIASGGSFAH